MNNFVIEQYLIYVTEKEKNNKQYYLLKKDDLSKITIFYITKGSRKKISLHDISSNEIYDVIKKYYNILKMTELRYATKYLSATLMRSNMLNMVEYGNAKECELDMNSEYNIRIVRYYYDAKGRMFTKMMGQKWKKR